MTRLAERWCVLVVANEIVASEILHEAIDVLGRGAEVLVVAPALNSRLAFWSSDEDRARRRADDRLRQCLRALSEAGVDVRGHVGDADPLLAVDDALRTFPANEIIVATHPEGQSNWLAHNVVARARARFSQPVHHIVVDPARGEHFIAA